MECGWHPGFISMVKTGRRAARQSWQTEACGWSRGAVMQKVSGLLKTSSLRPEFPWKCFKLLCAALQSESW